MKQGIKILGIGSDVGDTLITNNDFKHLDTTDEWIKSRTGIESRYYALNKTTLDLAYNAAIGAIKDAKIDKKLITHIIVATMTPDNFTPSLSQELVTKLGISAYALDINVACSGFIYALDLAKNILTNGYALVIGAEKISKILDFTDRSTCVLFGDAAGAIVIKKDNKYFHSYLKCIPDSNNILNAKGIKDEGLFQNTKEHGYLTMKGQDVFKFALNSIKDVINNLGNDFDYLILHQANLRIIDFASKYLNIDEKKIYINLNKYGNTSAASIPLVLQEMKEKNYFKANTKILLLGFGSGLSYGGILLEMDGFKNEVD